jgi:S1-C subfamily serine protease
MARKTSIQKHPVRHARTTHSQKNHKTVKIKHHHNKSYRKRHYGLLGISAIGGLLLFVYILQYNFVVQSGVKSAQNFVSGLLKTTNSNSSNERQPINSTYGFSIAYDPLKFYASAIDSATGGLYIGDELSTNRAYEVIRFSLAHVDTKIDRSTMTLTYHNEISNLDMNNIDYAKLEKTLVEEVRIKNKTPYTRQVTQTTAIAGISFVRTVWSRQVKSEFLPGYAVSFVSYTGVVGGKPVVMEINRGIDNANPNDNGAYDQIVNSLKQGERTQTSIVKSAEVATKTERSRSLLDKLFLTGMASAASAQPTVSASEKYSALFGPAVTKVYNAYCMDILLEGSPYLNGACSAGVGSGFFVNGNEGYLATNGHVASSSPKDIIIEDAVSYLLAGDERYFNALAEIVGTHSTDPEYDGKSLKEVVAIATDKMYGMDDSKITVTNNVSNLLVDLNSKQPDIEELIRVTKARQQYPEQESIKRAKFVAADFRSFDGIVAFKASDVALIKIEGSNYPVVTLGSISGVTQGSSLNILGFPANASRNGIVDDKESKMTLTTGKVSSLKNALGSDKKLIETDTTIGHGNSGGPVMNDSGEVFGIATYTADGSGTGDGVFNYIRDIQDLKDLASKNSVNMSSDSKTQKEWNKAMELFYKAHYSSAVKSFDKVKKLYPQHPTADSLIAASQERIKNGQDVKDFPILLVAGGVALVLLGGGAAAFMILKHKKAHNIYSTQVSSGAMQPLAPGADAQHVSYNPASVTSMGQPQIQPQLAVAPQTANAPAPVQAPTTQITQPNMEPQVTPQQPVADIHSPQPVVITPTVVQPQDTDNRPKL